jgi:hypothetical protein
VRRECARHAKAVHSLGKPFAGDGPRGPAQSEDSGAVRFTGQTLAFHGMGATRPCICTWLRDTLAGELYFLLGARMVQGQSDPIHHTTSMFDWRASCFNAAIPGTSICMPCITANSPNTLTGVCCQAQSYVVRRRHLQARRNAGVQRRSCGIVPLSYGLVGFCCPACSALCPVWRIMLVTSVWIGVLRFGGGDRCRKAPLGAPGYPGVSLGTPRYPEVPRPRGTSGYPELPRGTSGFPGVPRATSGYARVPRGTSGYPGVQRGAVLPHPDTLLGIPRDWSACSGM